MEELDQYMLRQTCGFAADVRSAYEEFAFHRIYHRVNHFCIVDLSAFYFDVLKDRLVHLCAEVASAAFSAQTAVWRIGEALVRLLAPVMSFHVRGNLALPAESCSSRGERASGAVSGSRGDSWRALRFPRQLRNQTRNGRACARFETRY